MDMTTNTATVANPSRRLQSLRSMAGRISILAIPFAAAIVSTPRLTMEQYELPKHVALILAMAVVIVARGLSPIFREWIAHPPVAGFVVAAVIATASSATPLISILGEYRNIEGLLTWLLYAALFAAGCRITGELRSKLIIAVIAAAALSAGYAIVELAGLDPFPGEDFRHVLALAGNPDFLAQQMAMALPLTLAALLAGDPATARSRIAAILTALFLFVLALTGSRAGMLAGVAGMLIVIWRTRDCARRRVGASVATGIVLVAAIVAAAALTPRGISLGARLSALASRGGFAETRGAMWHGVLTTARERPLTGWGPDMLKIVFLKYAPRSWASLKDMGTSARKAHNEPLHIFVSLGLIGLGTYLWLLVYVIRRFNASPRGGRRRGAGMPGSPDPGTMPEVWRDAVGVALAAYLVHNLFSFGTAATAPVFWILLGVLCAKRGQLGFSNLVVPSDSQLSTSLAVVLAIAVGVFSTIRLTADGYAYRGNEAGRAGDRASEIREFGVASRLAPWESTYFTRRARALELAGRVAAALPVFEIAARLRPLDGLQLAHVARVRFALATQRGDQAGRTKALGLMLESIGLSPSQPSLYGAAIMAAQQLGDISLRDRLARELRERDPEWARKMLGNR